MGDSGLACIDRGKHAQVQCQNRQFGEDQAHLVKDEAEVGAQQIVLECTVVVLVVASSVTLYRRHTVNNTDSR